MKIFTAGLLLLLGLATAYDGTKASFSNKHGFRLNAEIVDHTINGTKIPNANHIFNAVRGAMRQWDNSWNHNGMSFFLATVPAGVQFYHGTHQSEPVTGMQWLAFEPEHALVFARPRRLGPPKGGGPGRPTPPGRKGSPQTQRLRSSPSNSRSDQNDLSRFPNPDGERQRVLVGTPDGPPDTDGDGLGFLHFYRTKSDLKLIYIDGQSAGKSSKGTLDSQDYILNLGAYNATNSPFRERERANALCELTQTAWLGQIDGFVRMEQGFEIILCDFEANLDFERAQEVKSKTGEQHEADDGSFRLYRALADRFDGIGGDRVRIDYASMATAFDCDFELDLFVNDTKIPGQVLPRLDRQPLHDLQALKRKVTEIIGKAIDGELRPTYDWQSIAAMFVQRYATPLRYFAEANLGTGEYQKELRSLLIPFISDNTSRMNEAVTRCTEQFTPVSWPATLAGRAVQQVGSILCHTLLQGLHDIETASHGGATVSVMTAEANFRKAAVDLIAYLDWPIWRKCSPSCNYNEVCVLPIWPITGRIVDREQPKCTNSTMFETHTGHGGPRNSGYW